MQVQVFDDLIFANVPSRVRYSRRVATVSSRSISLPTLRERKVVRLVDRFSQSSGGEGASVVRGFPALRDSIGLLLCKSPADILLIFQGQLGESLIILDLACRTRIEQDDHARAACGGGMIRAKR